MKKISLLILTVILSLNIYSQWGSTYSIENHTFEGYTYEYDGDKTECKDCKVFMDIDPFDSSVTVFSDESFSFKFKFNKNQKRHPSKGGYEIKGKDKRGRNFAGLYGSKLMLMIAEDDTAQYSQTLFTGQLQRRTTTQKTKPKRIYKEKVIEVKVTPKVKSNPNVIAFKKTVNYFEQIVKGRYTQSEIESSLDNEYKVFKKGSGFMMFLKKGGHIMNKIDIVEYTFETGMTTISYTEPLSYPTKERYGEENLYGKGYTLLKSNKLKKTYINCSKQIVVEITRKGNGLYVNLMYLEGKDNIYLLHCK